MHYLFGFLYRIFILYRTEVQLWSSDLVTFRQKVGYTLSKFKSLPTNGCVKWFDHSFSSDNKLGLLLMPSYLFEVSSLIKVLALNGVDFNNEFAILDVGANVGQFSVTFMNSVPSAKVISIEPNSAITGLLSANNGHHVSRWQMLNFALGETEAKMNLYSVPGKSAQGSFNTEISNQMLLRNQKSEVFQVPVHPFRIEDVDLKVSTKFNKPDLLKVDVEGYEREAIRGLSAIKPRFVWIEVSTKKSVSLTSEQASELLASTFKCSVIELFNIGVIASDYDGNVLFELIYLDE